MIERDVWHLNTIPGVMNRLLGSWPGYSSICMVYRDEWPLNTIPGVMNPLIRATAAFEDMAQSLSSDVSFAPPLSALVGHEERPWAVFVELVGCFFTNSHAIDHGNQVGLCLVSQLHELIISEPLECCILEAFLHPVFPLLPHRLNTVRVSSIVRLAIVKVRVIVSGPVIASPLVNILNASHTIRLNCPAVHGRIVINRSDGLMVLSFTNEALCLLSTII